MVAKPDGGGYVTIVDSLRTAAYYGDIADFVTVTATETPDGDYYGWLDARRGPDQPPVMVTRRDVFEHQFPYGSAVETDRGRGTVITLNIKDTEP